MMKRAFAAGLLSLAVAAFGWAQTLPSSPAAVAGRELLAAGDPLEAAGAFHRALLDAAPGGFSLQVAVYCDLSNLEHHVRASGNPASVRSPPEYGASDERRWHRSGRGRANRSCLRRSAACRPH